jgi:hypothetical protein
MVAERNREHLRNAWPLALGLGLIGLIGGALAGYFGYSFGAVARNPLVTVAADSGEAPFDQTYRGMARLAGLEVVAARCNSVVDPRIIDQEKRLIDRIEVSSKKARLEPPLDVARAVVAYRGSAIQQEVTFLHTAGWKDTSPNHLAAIVRDLDGCQAQSVYPKEKQ